MAVRIPTYEERQSPSGMQSVQARGVEYSTAMGQAMQNVGKAGIEMAGRELAILKKKEDDDAVANVGESLASADAYWPNRVAEIARNTQNGGLVKQDDGSTVPMTQHVDKEFSTWRKSFLANIPNEKARLYAQSHLNTLWGNTYKSTITTEASLGVENRWQKVDQAVQLWAKTAAQNPGATSELVQSAWTMIANSGFDEQSRYKFAEGAKKTITEAALTGAIEQNPAGVKSVIQRHYQGGFDQAVEFTLRHEGGYNKADSNGAEVNFGINKAANPDVDVKNLTREQAKDIYKRKYWAAINGDELSKTNPGLAAAAFDTAVIAGPGKAKDLLEKSGGDAGKFLDLRQQFLDGLVKSNPKKYGPYQKAWTTRTNNLRSEVGLIGQSESINSLVGQISPDRLQTFYNHAQSEETRQMAVFKSQLTGTETDHIAAYMNGDSVKRPLTDGEYIKAYGPIEGPQRFANYQAIATMGADKSMMKVQTPAQIETTLSNYKPVEGQPGYDLANKRYALMIQAANEIRDARVKDPVQYAIDAKIGAVKSIDWNDTNAATAELRSRIGLAATMAGTYQTPYRMLSASEASNLSAGLQRMSAEQKLAFLSTIAKAVPDIDAQRQIFQQIAPDSPVTAVAANIAAIEQPGAITKGMWWWKEDVSVSPQAVARMILRGEELLNPNKADKNQDGKGKGMQMPGPAAFDSKFSSAVGKAFQGQAGEYKAALDSVRAYYAAAMEKKGVFAASEGAVDSDTFDEAVEMVIGGVTDVHGMGQVRRPWGMTESKFIDAANSAFLKVAQDLGLRGLDAQFGNYGLVNYMDGYRLFTGLGWLTDKNGKPVTLDLVGMRPTGGRPIDVPATPATQAKPTTSTPNTK